MSTTTGGEWIAQDIERAVSAGLAKLEHSGPWVRWRAPYLAGITPGLAGAAAAGKPLAALPLCAAGVGAAVYSEHRWGMDRWRSARLRHRWEKSELGRGSRIKGVDVHERGFITCTVTMRTDDWDGLRSKLHPEGGKRLRDLRLDGAWGEPFRFKLSDHGHGSPTRSRTLSLYYRRLPNSWKGLKPYVEPFRYPYLAIGEGYEGTVHADMRVTPHLVVVGVTRSGKGVLLKSIECQAIRGGCIGATIDGGASPEHGPLHDCPTWRAPMSDMTLDLAGRLRAAIACVADFHTEALNRERLCQEHNVDTYQQLPEAVKRKHPVAFLLADELTTLLAPTGEKHLDELRKTLAVKIDTEALRNGGKFGIIVVLADQMFYSGALSKGATQQARGRIILGNFASEHEKQMAGFTGLPRITEENLAGHWVVANDPTSLEEIRVYPNTRRDLEAAVKWSRGEAA
jgi:hypothetical protein